MCRSNLAVLLEAQGKLEAAEDMARRNMERQTKVLGRDHPDTLLNTSNLARLLASHSKYEMAEGIFRDLLEKEKEYQGRSIHLR